MSYPYILNGHVAKRAYLGQLLPLVIRVKTTEQTHPSHCGDGAHRQYDGKFCLSDANQGEILIRVSRYTGHHLGWETETGFAEREVIFAALDKTDGHFKVNVSVGGLPLEPCQVSVSQFLHDPDAEEPLPSIKKYGVRYTCDPTKWHAPVYILDGCGVAIRDTETGTFVWAALNAVGVDNNFVFGGQYGSTLYGAEDFMLNTFYNPKMYWTARTIEDVRHIETWVPNGTTLAHNVQEYPRFTATIGWEPIEGTDPPEPDYSEPVTRQVLPLGPWFDARGHRWRLVSWKQGSVTYTAYECSNGRYASISWSSQPSSLLDHAVSATGIKRIGAQASSNPLSNTMQWTDVWEVTPSDLHPDCDVWTVLARCKAYYLVRATDSATWSLNYYTTIDKSSGAIGYIHDWNSSDYAHLDVPTSGMFLANQAWLFTRHTQTRRSVAFRVFSNELKHCQFWRDSFLYNSLPGPPHVQGDENEYAEGQLGWGVSTSLPHGSKEYVFRDDLCLIGQVDDLYTDRD